MEKRIITEWYNKNAGQFYTVNKTLYKGKTKFQEIELIDTDEYGKVLLLDGFTQVVIKNEFEYHEPMVHIAMLSHPSPQEILIIGGGDGGILREVYRYPTVNTVDFVELDEQVVTFCQEYLPEINGGTFDHPGTHFIFDDGRKFTEAQGEKYDVIIMDMTDPFGPSAMLYTQEFFTSVKNALKDGNGIFVMHSESPEVRPAAFGSIRQTLATVFENVCPVYTYVQMYGTLWSFAISSDKVKTKSLPREWLHAHMERYGIADLHLINEESFYSMQCEYPYIKKILEKQHKIITDADPVFPDLFTQKS